MSLVIAPSPTAAEDSRYGGSCICDLAVLFQQAAIGSVSPQVSFATEYKLSWHGLNTFVKRSYADITELLETYAFMMNRLRTL
jgi:hypothetical protein